MNQTLYHETISALRPSEGKIEEVITMTEQKKIKSRGRAALIALAACAALIGSAGAANAVTGGEFWLNLENYIQVNVFKSVAVSPDGDTTALINMTTEIQQRDGRTILVVPGDEVDITDALIENGTYHYERTDGGTVCEVDVTGTPEHWTMHTAVYDEGEQPSVVSVTTSDNDEISVEGADGQPLEPGEEVEFSVSTFGEPDGTCEDSSTFVFTVKE